MQLSLYYWLKVRWLRLSGAIGSCHDRVLQWRQLRRTFLCVIVAHSMMAG
jgi:hypothetical protein